MMLMVTLSDVAKAAGVSLATASRAFNGSKDRNVRPELRERVIEAARRLNYTPNAAAQQLAGGEPRSVALVVHNIADPYFSTIAAGVERGATEFGGIVTLASTGLSIDSEIEVIETLRRQRPRVLILVGGLQDDAEELGRLRETLADFKLLTGAGVAHVGQPVLGVSTIAIDNEQCSADLARALLAQGFTRFGVLAGPPGHLTAAARTRGFTEAMSAGGATHRPPIHGDFTRDGGYRAMAELLDGPDVPEVVFAVNDVMAVGAMAAARERGVRVPDDVCVAGFDDILTLRDITPSLTTVHLDLEDIGEKAVQLALDDQRSGAHTVTVGGSVVLRESTTR